MTLWRSGGKFGLSLLIYDAPGGQLLYDWTLDASNVHLRDAEHGHESLSALIDVNPYDAFRVYEQLKAPLHTVLTNNYHAWIGRLEGREIVSRGLSIQALGYWRALSDYGPYTAFWSDSSVARWESLTAADISTAYPMRFEADQNNRLYMSARNAEGFSNTYLFAWGYQVPDESVTQIVACQFEYEMGGGSNWRSRLLTRDATWGSGSAQWTLNGAVGVQTGVQNLTFTATPALTFELEATGSVTIAASTGTGAYLKITKLRIAAAATNRVNTTIAAAIAAPGSQAVTPGSMANIYVGQKLWIGSGSTGEVVTVTAITSTTFTATFASAHLAGVTVNGIVIYGSEIAADIVGEVSTLNSTQLDSMTALIDTQDRDLENEIYLDKPVQDVLNYLTLEGETARYEVGVDQERRLYFRERGSQARAWYTDVIALQLGANLDSLVNRAYAVYRDANGGILRTDEADDDLSQAEYGVIRRGLTVASTTSETLAGGQRDAYLDEVSSITPRISIMTDGLRDASDNEYPLWMLQPNDELILRNLPPTLTTTRDRIRRFVVRAKEYDVDTDTLRPIPELELENIDIVIAGPRIKAAANDVKIDGMRLALAANDLY